MQLEGVERMKITKKTPLRQRGRSEDKRQATKEAIRDVYQNGPQREVQIIPAKRDLIPEAEKKKLRGILLTLLKHGPQVKSMVLPLTRTDC